MREESEGEEMIKEKNAFIRLKNAPIPIKECPICKCLFNPMMRGLVTARKLKFLFQRRYCLICENCKQIVGYEK